MCNIAGYIGDKRAAPILLDMIRKQEGFAGGYYTGLATIHEGKIYCAKLTGDTARLTENTDAANLPGNIGIIHSRSKAGGGDEWAHPFLGLRGDEITTAYVANGSMGCFALHSDLFDKLTQGLDDQGYKMLSRAACENTRYPKLADGMAVHMSDVMCQLILRQMNGGKAEDNAMEAAFCEMPNEIVGLMLSLERPDAIVWSRINMPMFAAFAEHGAYLSSTPIAIPADAGEAKLLSACSSGYVYRDGFTTTKFKKAPANVACIDAATVAAAYGKICEALDGGEAKSFPTLRKNVKSLFADADCVPAAALTYMVLDSLNKQCKLEIDTVRVDGAADGIDAPRSMISLK